MLQLLERLVGGGRGNVYAGYAAVTPSLFSTAAALTGLVLYNGSTKVNAYVLAASCAVSTASTVAGAIGMSGAATTAPASTTNATVGNLRQVANATPAQCNLYSVATPSNGGSFFLPIFQVGTGATTVAMADDNFVELGGAIEVMNGFYAALAASAVLTTAVCQLGLVWAEVPV